MPHALKRIGLVGAALATLPQPLFAHIGAPLQPHDLRSAWTLDPWLLFVLIGSASIVTAAAWLRTHARHSARRSLRQGWAMFAIGWLVVVGALVSPLDALSGALFSAHMVQHELLMILAAPLLILGRPWVVVLSAMPAPLRRRWLDLWRRSGLKASMRFATNPWIATAVHLVAVLVWHVGPVYDRALANESIHIVQHLTMFGTALLFWYAVLEHRRGARGAMTGVICLFFATVVTGVLGAALALGESLWFFGHVATTGPWGLSPLEDQQLAGAIMWVPGGFTYVIVALRLVYRAMSSSKRSQRSSLRPIPAAAPGSR